MLPAAEEHRVEIVSPPLPPSFSSSTVFGVVLPSPCHPTHPPHQDLDMVTVSACLPYICVCPMSMSVSYSGISLLNANSSVGSWLLMCHWPTLQWFSIHVSVSGFLRLVPALCSKRDLNVQQDRERETCTDTDSWTVAIWSLRLSLHCLSQAVQTFNVAGQNGNTQKAVERDGITVHRNVRKLRNTAQLD